MNKGQLGWVKPLDTNKIPCKLISISTFIVNFGYLIFLTVKGGGCIFCLFRLSFLLFTNCCFKLFLVSKHNYLSDVIRIKTKNKKQ